MYQEYAGTELYASLGPLLCSESTQNFGHFLILRKVVPALSSKLVFGLASFSYQLKGNSEQGVFVHFRKITAPFHTMIHR